MRSDRVAEIIDNLRRVFQVVNEQSKKAEKETGLTGPQLWAIKTIAQGAPIMVSELARRMYLHPATVVGILDRLESHKLVVRIRSTTDRRVVRAELTVQGKVLVKKAPTVAQGLLVNGLEQLTAKELKNIADGLDRLVDILGAQDVPAKLIRSPEVNKTGNDDGKSRKT
ncbi:MAG TPA: MarR family transcriptional regulator [Candidatus Sulfobium mesophilum]|nr:MarR family transcriptional regulator [Candidatus Sulfobium mesophilum]